MPVDERSKRVSPFVFTKLLRDDGHVGFLLDILGDHEIYSGGVQSLALIC